MSGSVVVIGGGVAGALSALAARRAGASVTLVRRAPGASSVSSGCFDFAAGRDAEGRALTIVEAAKLLARRRPAHPYARLGAGLGPVLSAARAMVVEELGLQGGADAARNMTVATPLGTLKETALAQGPIARGDLSAWPQDARIGVVGVRGAAGFDAELVASGLRAAGRDAVAVFVELANAGVGDLAALFEAPGGRSAFVAKAALAAQAAGATHLLVPTAGAEKPSETLDSLEAHGVVKAAELCAVPPSVPGLRLDRALVARLAERGVTVRTASVSAAERANGRVTALVLDDGTTLAADAVVLASGRFIGGGIRHGTRFSEGVFDLPVFVDDRDVGEKWTGELLDPHAAADQAALRAGVRSDRAMRPVDDRERVVFGNLFAAGSVIGGWDAAKDGAGLGVVAVTALVAGGNAAAHAADPAKAMPAPA